MDTELARTFLEIVSTGSFVHAAERLHVGQTTVSARIRLLEERLGRQLFVRNRNGATLTPAGEQALANAKLPRDSLLPGVTPVPQGAVKLAELIAGGFVPLQY